jgi:hypothetical protein
MKHHRTRQTACHWPGANQHFCCQVSVRYNAQPTNHCARNAAAPPGQSSRAARHTSSGINAATVKAARSEDCKRGCEFDRRASLVANQHFRCEVSAIGRACQRIPLLKVTAPPSNQAKRRPDTLSGSGIASALKPGRREDGKRGVTRKPWPLFARKPYRLTMRRGNHRARSRASRRASNRNPERAKWRVKTSLNASWSGIGT